MGKVVFVGAGPGAPDLITMRGRKLLDEADMVVYAGSLVNPALMDGIRAEVHDSAAMSLDEMVALMAPAAKSGKLVVRLHTGDISFYSAITEQIHRLMDEGVDVEIVPGVSSLGAGAAAIGQELTIPGITQSVVVTRISGRTPVPESESIASFAAHGSTMVIFLSVGMMEDVARELQRGGYASQTPVIVVERASWPEQRLIRGTIADIAAKVKEAGITKTALIYVGPALDASVRKVGEESKLYDGGFTHGYRKASQ